jgi:hypothetical protein
MRKDERFKDFRTSAGEEKIQAEMGCLGLYIGCHLPFCYKG